MSSIYNVVKFVVISLLSSTLIVACAKKGRRVPVGKGSAKARELAKKNKAKIESKALKNASKREKSLLKKLKASKKEKKSTNKFINGTYELTEYEVIISPSEKSKAKFKIKAVNTNSKDDLIKNLKTSLTEDLLDDDADAFSIMEDAQKLISSLSIPTKFSKNTNSGEESLNILDSENIIIGFNDLDPEADSSSEISIDSDNILAEYLKGSDKKYATDLDDLISSSETKLLTTGTSWTRTLEDQDVILIEGEIVDANDIDGKKDDNDEDSDDFTNMIGVSTIDVDSVNKKLVYITVYTVDKDTDVETKLTMVFKLKNKSDDEDED